MRIAEGGKASMFKTVYFNIYEENLEDIVYGEKDIREKNAETKVETDKPIPKPPPQFWDQPLNYKRFKDESEKAKSVL
jgi:hypothetical protein